MRPVRFWLQHISDLGRCKKPAFFLHLLFTHVNTYAIIKTWKRKGLFQGLPGRAERQDKMERNDMVMGVLEVYDRIQRLEAENAKLRAGMVMEVTAPSGDDPLAGIKARIMQVGREKLVEDSLNYWHSVDVGRNEDGVLKVTSYEKWLKDSIKKAPDFLSIVQFREICEAELKAEYESKKKESMDDLLSREAEKDDEE